MNSPVLHHWLGHVNGCTGQFLWTNRVEGIGRLGGVVYILETAKNLLSRNEGEEGKEI